MACDKAHILSFAAALELLSSFKHYDIKTLRLRWPNNERPQTDRCNCMIIDCYKILKHIEPRPAMWTGEATLQSIHNYISGYYHALLDNRIVQKPHTDEPFFDWVANKLGYYESTAGWVNMILAYCMGFEAKNISWEEVFATPVTKEQHLKSIKYFYELVEEFKKETAPNSD